MNCVRVNVDLMKVYVIQGKNGVMMNVDVSVKSYMVDVLVKMIICGILVFVIVSVIKDVKLTKI